MYIPRVHNGEKYETRSSYNWYSVWEKRIVRHSCVLHQRNPRRSKIVKLNPPKFRALHRFQYQLIFNVMRYCDTVLTASLLLAGYPKTTATNNIVVNRHISLNPASFILEKPTIFLARRLKRSRFWSLLISFDLFPSRLFLHNQILEQPSPSISKDANFNLNLFVIDFHRAVLTVVPSLCTQHERWGR